MRVRRRKGEVQKRIEELKQQLSAKVAELEIERKEKVAGADRVEGSGGRAVWIEGGV